MTPINDGANDDSGDDAAEAFLKTLMPESDASKKKPSQADDDTNTEDETVTETTDDDADGSEETPETEGDETEGTDEAEGEETEKKRKFVEDDGVYTKVTVGDEELEVPVKDLKRLYGQEAALTKRSQEVAEKRKTLDTEGARYLAQTQALLTRAQERAKPYAELDFLALSRRTDITDEELTSLRREAQSAFDDVNFLTNEANNFMGAIQKQQLEAVKEVAKATLVELADPDKGISGWSEKLYDDIRSYAITAGAPADTINKLVDAWAIKLIHKARLYDLGSKKVVTTKVNKTPKKVVKTTTSPAAAKQTLNTKAKAQMKTLQEKGTTDAAAAVFLAQLTRSDDE